MKRFTNHPEPWGDFIDVKISDRPINLKQLWGRKIFLSSVTDCYNSYEKEFKITRSILEQIKDIDSEVTVATKSDLILRDIDLLKQFKNLTVAFSINTIDAKFQSDMDKASSIDARINALKVLHEHGIKTVVFMSPIFPYITDFREIINNTKNFVGQYWFENLNLRGDYKYSILNYVKDKFPEYYAEYQKIYVDGDVAYWDNLENEIIGYCQQNGIDYKMYFHHEKIRK
jgi:DNA repair photolyase